MDSLSWEVSVENRQIEIPAAYVELSGISSAFSFAIKVGPKGFWLIDEGDEGIEYYDDQCETRESDGATVLKYLTQINHWDRIHIIPSMYVDYGEFEERQKFEVKVGKGNIKLIRS